jgi:hypothetical protein
MKPQSVASKSRPPVSRAVPVSGLPRGRLHHVAAVLCALAAGAVLSQGTASALPAGCRDWRICATPSATATAPSGQGALARRTGNHGKAVGPSLSVIGFGVNRLFVPKGTTVKSSSMCDEMVGSDTPIGPPQQIYLTVYARATDIPPHAPTQIKDSLPEGDEELDIPEFTTPAPFSKAFAKGAFSFGAPEGNQKDLFYTAILSASAEEGEYEGPSAEEFDGTYSYTASVKVGPHTLTSTAKVTVDCPQLR